MFGNKNVLTNVAKTNEHSNITTLFVHAQFTLHGLHCTMLLL